jgi:hypothetical protein
VLFSYVRPSLRNSDSILLQRIERASGGEYFQYAATSPSHRAIWQHLWDGFDVK